MVRTPGAERTRAYRARRRQARAEAKLHGLPWPPPKQRPQPPRRVLPEVELAPDMPEAVCRGRANLFSPADGGDLDEAGQQMAIDLCRQCGELPTCRAWLAKLPASKRPPGVTAGTVNQ